MLLTETFIADRLHRAMEGVDAASNGYSEIELTDETRLRCAAVFVPLVWQAPDWHLLYTRRTDRVDSHKGQVSFPGGGCDAGETTPEATALRELYEEIGIEPSKVRVLGRLLNMITITSFRVTPVVGVLDWPTVLRVGADEVERVFTVPLSWLADEHNRWEFSFPGRHRGVIAYHPYDGELLWGATARITVDFLGTLGL
jgi:8-oxo-dGTP pyrophosphatase MutT (NUDIX family)